MSTVPPVLAAAHSRSPYGKAFSGPGVPLAPITQAARAFFEDHGIYDDHRAP